MDNLNLSQYNYCISAGGISTFDWFYQMLKLGQKGNWPPPSHWYFQGPLVLQVSVDAVISSTNEKEISDYRKGDYLGLYNFVKATDWNKAYTACDIDIAAYYLNKTLSAIIKWIKVQGIYSFVLCTAKMPKAKECKT